MAIGRSLDIRVMLKTALLAYLRKMNCSAGIVYREEEGLSSLPVLVTQFCIPTTLDIARKFPEVIELFLQNLQNGKSEEFKESLPRTLALAGGQFCHLLNLDGFGYLVLIRDTQPLDGQFVKSLLDINQKLANSCLACLANENLQESEAKFRRIFDNLQDVYYRTMLDGTITEISISVESYGYKREALLGRKVHELYVDPGQRESMMGCLKEAGSVSDFEIELKDARGASLVVSSNSHIVRDRDGVPYRVEGVLRNISERKSSELELRKLSQVVEQSPSIILMTDLNGRIDYVNPRFTEVTGFTPEEVKGRFPNFIRHTGMDANPHLEEINDTLARGDTWSGELFSRKKNGEIFWILSSISPIKDEQGLIVNYLAVEEVITKQKNFQDTLEFLVQMAKSYINLPVENLETEINRALKAMGEYVRADRTYIFTYDFSKNTTSNTYEWCAEGISPEIGNLQDVPMEFIPQWVEEHKKGNEMYTPDVKALPEGNPLREILEPQGIQSLLTLPMMREGELIGFMGFDSVRSTHVYSANERSILTVFAELLMNLQERVSSVDQLSRAKETAVAANQAKSEFLANMSHEIRTPMNAILGFSEALFHNLKNEHNRRMVQAVLSSGNLLLSLLNDILDLSKIEAGKLEILLRPMDLRSVLRDIHMLYADKAQSKNLTLINEVDPNVPDTLYLDEVRIKQIIFNLVGNAVKFTARGFVKTTVGFEAGEGDRGRLTIEVLDSGIGVPEEQKHLIFESFRQQSGQSSREYEGVGLGLAISRRLAEKMGGTIRLDSTVGEGSSFRLVLEEVRQGEQVPLAGHSIEPGKDLLFHKGSVLVVDDVESNIAAFTTMFQGHCIVIEGARSGEEALEKMEVSLPQVIFLDIRMPGMDGYEVVRRIKSRDDWKHIPVIALTASLGLRKDPEKQSRFDGVLYKPVKKNELVCELAKYLPFDTVEPRVRPKGLMEAVREEAEEIGEELRIRISKALQGDLLTRWASVKDTLDLIGIRTFAEELNQMALESALGALGRYAQGMIEDVETFDLESLQGELLRFKDVVESYKTPATS
ncbi:MAG: PAS domain S-box protein [Bacteroidales bacterium]